MIQTASYILSIKSKLITRFNFQTKNIKFRNRIQTDKSVSKTFSLHVVDDTSTR